ncbi:hypothetical protein WMY93_018765 [Mugilogobius chulae]|uniref:Uncharacterized protein n=1 Tax=Mugilogobius chulae TaxID=88201 RepID=A0AAW0NWL5_9GOBI
MTVAVREILAVVERTVIGYEEEVLMLKRELNKKGQLDAILQPRVYLSRIDSDAGARVLCNGEEVRHVQDKIMKNGTSRQRPEENNDEPTAVSHDDSDCSFADLPSDSSEFCLAQTEKSLRDDTLNYAQKTKVKRRRRLPKRYRSNDDATDSENEKKMEKWKPDKNKKQQSFNVKKKNVIKLRFDLLKECHDINLSQNGFRLKDPSQTVFCQRNLSESEFLNRLRSSFPELGDDKPLEAVLLDRNKRTIPHTANRLTLAELYKAFRNAENHLAFYIIPKEHEETPTSSPDHKLSASHPEDLLSEIVNSQSLDEQDDMFSIISTTESEDGENAVVERTVIGYEEEVLILKRELSQKKEQLDAILQPRVHLNRIVLSRVLCEGEEVRHVQDQLTRRHQGLHPGENNIVDEPSLSHDETDFADLPSDSSEFCLADDTLNDAQKTKTKRRRRLPKRYRSNDDETDSESENNREKEWKPNKNNKRQSSNVNKKHVIKLRIGLLEKSDTSASQDAFRHKGPIETIFCQQNLSEFEFFKHLRSSFPELEEDKQLEAVLRDRNKRVGSVEYVDKSCSRQRSSKVTWKLIKNYISVIHVDDIFLPTMFFKNT